MDITINNRIKHLTGHNSLTLQQLLNMEIPEKQKGIAVAVNNIIIPKTAWEEKTISHNDVILIIKATQGG